MADAMDLVQQRVEEERQRHIRAARAKTPGVSRVLCIECEAPITVSGAAVSTQLAICGKQSGKSSSVHAVSGTGQRHADAFWCSYAGDNRRQAVVAGTGADGRTGESMAPD